MEASGRISSVGWLSACPAGQQKVSAGRVRTSCKSVRFTLIFNKVYLKHGVETLAQELI
jgi:hypothetical protein